MNLQTTSIRTQRIQISSLVTHPTESLMESHLEALFLPFLSSDLYAIIRSLWPWVAVFTTAFSLWGIKSVGSHPLPTGEDDSVLFHHHQRLQEESQEETKPAAHLPCHLSCDVEGTTKRKFTMYLEDCEFTAIAQEDYTEEEEEIVVDTICCWESSSSWELMFVKRSMDLGWYINQNLNALDGRVVKLWEDERRRRPSLLRGTAGWSVR